MPQPRLGGVTVLSFHGQGFGLAVPSEFPAMRPYLATIAVLVVNSRYAEPSAPVWGADAV
jgi:ABC-type uncharacterized transport system permease subunit